METFIVRIYVRDPDVPEGIAGTVERVEAGCVQSFVGLSGLVTILSSTDCADEWPRQSVPNP